MQTKLYMYVGSYIFYDNKEELHHGAEYGLSSGPEAFVKVMHDDVQRDYPGATGYEGIAWRMSDQGMQAVARTYMQRYIEQE